MLLFPVHVIAYKLELTLTEPLLKHYSALLQVVTENQKTYLSLTKIFCKESVPKREDTGWSILLCTSELKQLLVVEICIKSL